MKERKREKEKERKRERKKDRESERKRERMILSDGFIFNLKDRTCSREFNLGISTSR